MANFCLIPSEVDKFKEALTTGKIDPDKLSNMSSDERRDFFKDIVGEGNSKSVNALFESKLLLKNQQQGMITWAKKVSGLTPEVRRDMVTRIEKLNKVLNPDEHEQFLKDLASTKLGVNVTREEAKTIANLSQKVTDTKTALSTGGDRLEYGRAKVALGNYVNNLTEEASKQSLGDMIRHPEAAHIGKSATTVASIAKSVKASLDNSAIFRQGWKTMFTDPVSWQRNARKSFGDIVKEFGGKNVLDEIHADIVSRPNYDKMVKARLATSNIEEAYPTHLPAKIPVLGRAYKASEAAYTGFLYRQRADIFDKYLQIAKKSGVNIDSDKELKALGKLVNSLTGRGHLGGLEPAANTINSVFFSPRTVKANIDTLTAHQFQKGVTPFVRKQAALSTLKIITGTAAVMAIADAISPGSVEFDPRSSDFGKIKIGDTRFDVTGGIDSVATLAARLVKQSTKSSSTGVVSKLGSKPGQESVNDVLTNFLENKLSPAASVIKDLATQQDFQGNKPTPRNEAFNLLTPLPLNNIQELRKDPDSANTLLGSIADGLGIVTNSYQPSTTNWNANPGKILSQFKSKVGNQKFQQANKEYNTQMNNWLKNNLTGLKKLPPEKEQTKITTEKAKVKSQIMESLGFKYQKS